MRRSPRRRQRLLAACRGRGLRRDRSRAGPEGAWPRFRGGGGRRPRKCRRGRGSRRCSPDRQGITPGCRWRAAGGPGVELFEQGAVADCGAGSRATVGARARGRANPPGTPRRRVGSPRRARARRSGPGRRGFPKRGRCPLTKHQPAAVVRLPGQRVAAHAAAHERQRVVHLVSRPGLEDGEEVGAELRPERMGPEGASRPPR